MNYRSRKRNLFDPASTEPFKLSRSKIDAFLKCPRCFYLDRRLGIDQPSMPPFNLNKAVDELLKREFDGYRKRGEPHPLMQTYGLSAVPFAHPDLTQWRENFTGIQFLHPKTNFIVHGAIDDVWKNGGGELMIVDYKATSTDREITLDSWWRESWKRQVEIYQWLFRQSGFSVSPTAYFVCCNARKNRNGFDKKLEFELTLLDYKGDDSWVEEILLLAKNCLCGDKIPPPNPECEHCTYRQACRGVE